MEFGKTLTNLKQYDIYKYSIETKKGKIILKADPYGTHAETRPATASKIFESNYVWNDAGGWSKRRKGQFIKPCKYI